MAKIEKAIEVLKEINNKLVDQSQKSEINTAIRISKIDTKKAIEILNNLKEKLSKEKEVEEIMIKSAIAYLKFDF